MFATLPECVGKGTAGKIPASVVAGMCSTIIRRMVEEIHRTGTSELLASLITGNTVSFCRENVERAVRDLKERKHSYSAAIGQKVNYPALKGGAS